MILPGISGSFILLLVGLYPVFLNAVKTLDLVAIASFGSGCICGLLLFSRFLSWLLDHYYKPTIALLVGFLVGSLNVTWPWKQTEESVVNGHGETVPVLQSNVLPWDYFALTHNDPQIIPVILWCIAGVCLVLFTELLANKLTAK